MAEINQSEWQLQTGLTIEDSLKGIASSLEAPTMLPTLEPKIEPKILNEGWTLKKT